MTVEMPDVRLEVDFGNDDGAIIGDPDLGKIGTATIGGTNSFVDVSSDIRKGRIVRGHTQFSGVYARATAGSCNVTLDNRSADYDPTNLAGTYVDGGETLVKPRRRVRLFAPAGVDESYVDLAVASVLGDASTFSATLDDIVELRVRLQLPDAFASLTLPAVRRTSGEDIEWSYASGALTCVVENSGGTPIDLLSVTAGFTDYALYTPIWLRLRFDPDTGSGSSIQCWRSPDGATWEDLGSDTSVTAHSTAAWDQVDVRTTSGLSFFQAEVYADATLVAAPDVTGFDETSAPYTFTDSEGASWEVDTGDAIVASDRVPTWSGEVKAWQPDYPAGFDRESTTELVAVDTIAILARIDGREQSSQGGGELSGARIDRILTQAGWPAGARVVGTGKATMQATTLAQNAWSELQLTSDTEFGELYIDGSGRVVFRGRDDVLTDTRSTVVQAVFGDRADLGEVPILEVSVSYDDEQIINDAQIARAGGSAVQALHTGSIAEYGTLSFTRSDLLHESDDVSEGYARYLLGLFAEPELRIDTISINARTSEVTRRQAFRREIGDRVQVRISPPGRATRIEREVFIRGISHEFDYSMLTWVTRFALQDAERFQLPAVLGEAIIGTSKVGF